MQQSHKPIPKADAHRRLQSLANVGRTTVYDALKLIGGRHSDILWQRENVKIGLNVSRSA